MNLYEQFSYVDGHYEHKAKKIRTRWVRMRAKDVRELVIDKAGGSNCFSTVQRFKDAVSMRDRDVKEEAERQKETPEQVIARMELEPHLYGEKSINIPRPIHYTLQIPGPITFATRLSPPPHRTLSGLWP